MITKGYKISLYAIPGIATFTKQRNINTLLEKAANYHGKDWERIISKDRSRYVSDNRKIIMNWLRGYGFSLKEIGNALGKKDHTTVIYCIEKYNALYQTSDEFREEADLFNCAFKN